MAEAKEQAKSKKQTLESENEEQAVTAVAKDVVTSKQIDEPASEPTTAKAGKRSPKAIKEAEEKQAKEERKAAVHEETEESAKPKAPVKPARSKLERKGKKFREAAKLVEKGKQYSLKEAIDLALKTNTAKFDATVELHVNLGVDPRHADQNIRGTVSLPAGSGKTIRVAVFADTDDAKKAKDAGADMAGSDDLLQLFDKEQFDFDVLIATPTMMAKLGKYARSLGPKGLMPNPKSGTVTPNVAQAVKEAKAGKVEYRVDSTGIVHLGVGKASFSAADLQKNIQTVFAGIKASKPASLKGNYVKAVYLTTTMGPSIGVATTEI